MLSFMKITKEELENKIKDNFSKRKLAVFFNMSPTGVEYYLRKFNLKTNYKIGGFNKEHQCERCNENDPLNFYGTQKSLCKKCRNDDNRIKYQKYKEIDIAKRGGKCQKCNYNKYIGALEFHHLDPNQKDPDFNSLMKRSPKGREQELNKCIILCSNCHKETHANIE